MRHFSAQELKDYLAQADNPPFLLDVRETWEFAYCHIEGSELIPMGDIPETLSELDPNRETVVICHHGIRSRQVAWYLEHNGFTNLINLDGGVENWAKVVDPSMKRY
ncbi:MAG: rhodanese-like domain-containing protein [Gammaproteobacteria bacterium]|nr:rhodanese-like domain-containing protein [Gammaproteobacteria bacterium]MDH5651843.1 rhodanese-like domain-containing protein [Gammaproteobacteria bacterium]